MSKPSSARNHKNAAVVNPPRVTRQNTRGSASIEMSLPKMPVNPKITTTPWSSNRLRVRADISVGWRTGPFAQQAGRFRLHLHGVHATRPLRHLEGTATRRHTFRQTSRPDASRTTTSADVAQATCSTSEAGLGKTSRSKDVSTTTSSSSTTIWAVDWSEHWLSSSVAVKKMLYVPGSV